jgi:hypothetical protein
MTSQFIFSEDLLIYELFPKMDITSLMNLRETCSYLRNLVSKYLSIKTHTINILTCFRMKNFVYCVPKFVNDWDLIQIFKEESLRLDHIERWFSKKINLVINGDVYSYNSKENSYIIEYNYAKIILKNLDKFVKDKYIKSIPNTFLNYNSDNDDLDFFDDSDDENEDNQKEYLKNKLFVMLYYENKMIHYQVYDMDSYSIEKDRNSNPDIKSFYIINQDNCPKYSTYKPFYSEKVEDKSELNIDKFLRLKVEKIYDSIKK